MLYIWNSSTCTVNIAVDEYRSSNVKKNDNKAEITE